MILLHVLYGLFHQAFILFSFGINAIDTVGYFAHFPTVLNYNGVAALFFLEELPVSA
jgi:hypothetical protein